MLLDTIISREQAFRFAFISVSSLLIVGANAAWNGLGYLNPIAWFLEWSDVILAFFCVLGAVRTKELSSHLHGYILIGASLAFSAISYAPSVAAPMIHGAINQSIDPYDFLILVLPVLFLPLLIQHDLKNRLNSKIAPFLFFISVIVALGYLLYMFCLIAPQFPTDESAFDMYAAHLFLLGKNPYDPALMSGAFNFYHFQLHAFDPITPLTTGGYVNELTYPALSFLVFIPAVILHLKASVVMLPVLLAPVFIVWYRAWSRKQWLMSSYALLPFISLLLYTYQGASADTDALWASLLMLSYPTLPRNKTSGILFGLSLSVKQLPFIAAPFFLYFIYREYGTMKAMKWLAMAFAAFFIVNGYFIFENPSYWFSSMVANEFAPLIGIGFGVTQIAFTGLLQIPNLFFTLVMLNLLLVFFLVYAFRYRELKYALFIFPIPIFLFNYRLFPQYLFYWILISLIPMLDNMVNNDRNGDHARKNDPSVVGKGMAKSTKIGLSFVVLIILSSAAIAYHDGVQNNPGSFDISSVSYNGYNSSGYVNSMNLVISYHGNMNHTHVYFRVLENGPVVNGNMFLWITANNMSLEAGHTYNITITPQYQDYSVNPSSDFMLVAYYGNIQGSYYFNS